MCYSTWKMHKNASITESGFLKCMYCLTDTKYGFLDSPPARVNKIVDASDY